MSTSSVEDAYYGETPGSAYHNDDSNKTYPMGVDSYDYADEFDQGAAAAYGHDDKEKEEEADLWYGALSVAVLTLGLILVVEEVRHRLDHAAIGKPFFASVLDGVYRELATLGVVELAIHLLQTYSNGLDKNRKAVFADVHFLLFYTAVLNAFQAAILSFCANRVSNGLWVKTEELELDHYVEIREEFDRIRTELYGDSNKTKGFSTGYENFRKSFESVTEDQSQSNMDCLKNFFLGTLYTVIFPRQKAKYNRLLIQVRFHELRVHFLESYDLPLKMKVSDYLVKSMMHVLEHFVHVSHSTWLILTALCNVLYFLMGLSADVSGIAETSGYSLSIIFLSAMVGFVVLSLMIYYHMESVFKKLMKMNHLWDINDEVSSKRKEDLAAEQNGLFFLGDPLILLKWIKFMQFGYAVAISVIIVYWDDMEADDDFNALAYILATFICYSVFVAIMARVLPLYCVTTSMGQLVDKERLHEVRSIFRLQEAERRRHEDISVARNPQHGLSKEDATSQSLVSLDLVGGSPRDQSSEESSMVPIVVPQLLDGSEASPPEDSPPRDRRAMLADLVKLDTKSLRSVVPPNSMEDHSGRTQSKQEGRRSLSDGVSSMRFVGNSSQSFHMEKSADLNRRAEATKRPLQRKVTFDETEIRSQSVERSKRRDRRKTKSEGAAVQAMREFKEPFEDPGKARHISVLAETEAKPVTSKSRPSSDTKTATPLLAGVLTVVPAEHASATPTSKTEKVSDDDTSVSGLSDVVDTPVWNPGHRRSYVDQGVESVPRISCTRRVAKFFEGPTYKFITHICGTMVAFFLVGMRVEAFLKQQCIIPQDDHSWDLPLHDSFRLLIAWIASFIGTSLLNVIISPEQKQSSLFIAATFDVILCGICLLIMLEAENQRCCDDAFGPKGLDGQDTWFRLQDECVDSTVECTCLDFGHRVYGGYGNIEPYTALIGIRVFRFYIANKIVAALRLQDGNGHADHGHGGQGHGHGHTDSSEKGTAVELWQAAMARFPELVEKHGEFSGEVLQAMLGIEVVESTLKVTKTLEPDPTKTEDTSRPVVVAAEPKPDMDHVFINETKYKCLTERAQEIIAAGKMGLPVKPCPKKQAGINAHVDKAYAAAPMAPLEFEYDQKTDEVEHTIDSAVSYPNARLVRSMRRCERKLLPLLNKWTPVDVVITNHEMVYVDVNDDHDDEITKENIMKREAAKEAVIATDGGKGLRLCDVVTGRRIVGHLSFSDVMAVHVEREEPCEQTDLSPRDIPCQNEYWQTCDDAHAAGGAVSRQERWEKVNQDRLRILTMHGTLFLRFHSDLHDSEMHPERILEEVGEESPLHKDIAFQWAQTLVRHCGVSQLQQELPHFGHGDGDELRDYLVIFNRESKHHGNHNRLHAWGLNLPAAFKRHQGLDRQSSTTNSPATGITSHKDESGNLSYDI